MAENKYIQLTEEQLKNLNEIKLPQIYAFLGGNIDPKTKYSSARVKIGDFRIISKYQAWEIVHGGSQKGYGGIELVKVILGLDNYYKAAKLLLKHFGDDPEQYDKITDEELMKSGKSDFSPPDEASYNIEYVKNYLVKERGIPSELINQLVENGKIYADNKRNCVFIGPASAEIRSTEGNDFKGCSAGSQGDISGFTVLQNLNANENVVALVEGAIDAISYNALYPGKFALSSNGIGKFEIQYKAAIEAISNQFKLYLAHDADLPGDEGSQRLFNSLLVRRHMRKHFGVNYLDYDRAVLSEKVVFDVELSPHHLFINNENVESQYLIYEKKESVNNDVKDVEWINTNKLGKIEVKVKFNVDLTNGKLPINTPLVIYPELSEINLIKKVVKRHRPKKFKDWNDELKFLGNSYITDYNKCFKENFVKVPKLPDYLEMYREPTKKIKLENGVYVYDNSEPIISKENNNNCKIDLTKLKQDIFNTIYLQLLLKTKFNFNDEDIIQSLKNKKVIYDLNIPNGMFIEKLNTDKNIEPEIRLIFNDNVGNVLSGKSFDIKIKPTTINKIISDYNSINKQDIALLLNLPVESLKDDLFSNIRLKDDNKEIKKATP